MTDLEAFIERRTRAVPEDRAGQEHANALEELWRRSEARHRERLRRENGAAWYEFHMRLADNHAGIAREHEAKALALLEEPGP